MDLAFVRKMLSDPAGPGQARESGFQPEMLFDEGRKVFDAAMAFFTQHGRMPAIETLEAETGVSLALEPPEPLGYYVKEVLHRWKGNTVGAGLKAAVKALEKGDPDASIRTLMETAGRVRAVGGQNGMALQDLTDEKSIQERLAEYDRVKALGGKIDGIQTPWATINRVTRGIHDDELWVVVGKLKSTKTFQIVVLALHAWETGVAQGRKVLLVSEEMGVPKIARRWDAVHAQLPYGDFKRGQLAQPAEERWRKALEGLKGKPSFWVAGRQRVKTVDDLDLLIDELRPDVTFVDGAYFLDNEGGTDSKWERTAGVVDRLQALVQRRRHPVVVSWQFNRKKVKTGSTEGFAEDVAFAYELVMAADVVLGIFRNEDLERKNQAVLRMVEARESERSDPLLIECNFATMSFAEIGPIRDQEVASEPVAATDIQY